MIWPWTVMEERRRLVSELSDSEVALQHARRECADAERAAREATEAANDLLLQRTKLNDEIAALKAPKPEPPVLPLLVCPACASKFAHVMRHIVGWRRSERGAVPEALGATVQCVDCGTVWHATECGAERAKPVERQRPREKDGERARNLPDSDLLWKPK